MRDGEMDPAQALWEECGWRMRQLRDMAQHLRTSHGTKGGRVLLARTLSIMEAFREYVNENILLPGQIDVETSRDIEVADAIDELLLLVETSTGWRRPTIEEMQHTRDQDARAEEAAAAQTPENQCEVASQSSAMLVSVVRSLRSLERSRGFHRGLLLAATALKHESEYSIENYAYGYTPLDSWARVCSHQAVLDLFHPQDSPAPSSVPVASPTIATATRKCLGGGQSVAPSVTTPCVVFGSSTGSLVFFTSLLLNQPCTGVEILPFLHITARSIQLELNLEACSFMCVDMLQTRLLGTRFLILTSQCWDNGLYQLVVSKVENELVPGALVIDYRDGLAHSRHFRLRDRVSGVRVSWSHAQTLFFFERTAQDGFNLISTS